MASALHRLWHTDVKRGFLLSLLTCTHGGIAERTSDSSLLWIVKLEVAGEEEKGREAVSVCYRVGLRGLSKRLYEPGYPEL